MTRFRPAALMAAMLAVAACNSGNSSGPNPGTTGTLAVTITAPAGVSARVAIIAPDGSITTITSSQTLSALPAGTYKIVAEPGVTSDPIVGVGYAGVVTGSPAAIPAGGGASASVTYSTPWAAAGHLWVTTGTSNTILGFTSAQLSATGAPTAAVILGNGSGTSAVKSAGGVAVDSRGGVWYTDLTDSLFYYSAAQAASSTNSTPSVRLVAPSIASATAAVLDAQGDLWVADQFGNTISEFTSTQLTASGTVTPAVTISAVLGSIMRPWGLTFDAAGDLWVVNYNGNSVVGFSPAQLAASGAPVPFAGVSGSQGITGPLGAAFDAQGNLWVATIVDSIAKFNAADLSAIGTPTPAVILTGAAQSSPITLAFDASGALWVGNYQQNTILRYNANQLGSTGSPAPAAIITIGAVGARANGIAFSPPAANLPVH